MILGGRFEELESQLEYQRDILEALALKIFGDVSWRLKLPTMTSLRQLSVSFDLDAVESLISPDALYINSFRRLYGTPDEFLSKTVPPILESVIIFNSNLYKFPFTILYIYKVFGGWEHFQRIFLQTKVAFSDTILLRKSGRGSHLFKAPSIYCPSTEDIASDPFNVSLGGFNVTFFTIDFIFNIIPVVYLRCSLFFF